MDQNGDGNINQDDRRPFHDPAPKWILGHSSYLTYGNFDLGFTLRAYLGNYVYNNVASNLGTTREVTPGSPYNLHASVLETGFETPQYLSDYYVEDASFLRMDNITLGYTFNLSRPAGAGLRHGAERVHDHRLQRRGSDRGAQRHRQQHLSALAHLHRRPEPPVLSHDRTRTSRRDGAMNRNRAQRSPSPPRS